MIITRTPLRVSFFGGGTDLRGFYEQEEGCVLSTAINKYIYVILKDRFDDRVRVGYSQTELVDDIDQLKHELVRESLRKVGLTHCLEIATMADIPSAGSGLGSSSAVTVGLLNALYAYQNRTQVAETLAREACEIEIETLGKPIGKQDQYIAAYGGLRFMRFQRDGKVAVQSVAVGDGTRERIERYLMLFYTDQARRAETILAEQAANTGARIENLNRIKQYAHTAHDLLKHGCFDDFGRLLHEAWQEKKALASGVTNGAIDAMYDAARKAGALGGKITGAGGGGFLMLWVAPDDHEKVRAALYPLRELPVRLEQDGTRVLLHV